MMNTIESGKTVTLNRDVTASDGSGKMPKGSVGIVRYSFDQLGCKTYYSVRFEKEGRIIIQNCLPDELTLN